MPGTTTDTKEYETLRAAAKMRWIKVSRFTDEDGGYYCISIGIYMRIVFDLDALEAALFQMGVTT